MSKLQQHFAYLSSFLPEFGGMQGFIFYSLMTYLVVLFFGWLLNPTVDKIIADDIKNSKLKNKGAKARQMNLDDAAAATSKAKKQ